MRVRNAILDFVLLAVIAAGRRESLAQPRWAYLNFKDAAFDRPPTIDDPAGTMDGSG
jgi:hypothetical protein